MDLRRQLGVLRRWFPFMIVGGAVAGILAYAVLAMQPLVYEAAATVKLGQTLSGSPILVSQVSDRLLTEYAYRATSRATLAEVAAAMGLDADAAELQGRVTAVAEPTSTLLTITARADSAEGAAELANAVGEALITISEEAQGGRTIQRTLIDDLQTLRDEIEATRAEIARLSSLPNPDVGVPAQVDELETRLVALIETHGEVLDRVLATGAHTVEFVSMAVPPTSPVEPRPLLYTALAVFTGLLVAGAIAVVIEYFDDTLREPEDLEQATGLPLLGSLIELTTDAKRGGDNRLVTVSSPRSSVAEEYRRLRANLELAAKGRLQALLVTGSEPAPGTSVAAANLAVAFAESGRRVLLVDGNFRRPEIHTFFRLPNERGLSTLLEYDSTPVEQVMARSRLPNLSIITTGSVPVNPTRSLGTDRLKNLIVQFHRNHDIVIFDSPPLPTTSDALVLASELHHTLLVVTRGKTRRATVRQALDALGIARADVVGTAYFTRRRGASVAEQRVPVGPAPMGAQPQAAAGQQKSAGSSLGRPGSA